MRYLLLFAVLGCVLLIATRRDVIGFERPTSVTSWPEATAVIQLEFGLQVQNPRGWNGAITTSAGEIESTWGWHFIYPDRIAGNNGWSLATRLYKDPEGLESKADLPVAVLPNGVYCAIKAPDTAVLQVNTNRGNYSFRLAELKSAGRLSFLDGDAAAVYTPPARPLTRGAASQHDFPSVATSAKDTFAAWVTYQNEANFVYMAQRREGNWTIHRVTDSWGDYYGSAVAADSAGNAHVVWSEYKSERWRLVSRMLNASTGQWGPQRYIAPDGRRQMFHSMATDAQGAPWITWQEYGNGNFDIYAAHYEKGAWSSPLKISESAANDWNPAIAAAPDGAVYVAWDSYDAGNYDILLRTIRGGKPGPIMHVTQSPTFDAHVSLAVDPNNRLWLAWEEAGPNWGKDTGVLLNPGNALYTSREIRLVRYENGRFFQPASPLVKALPGWLASMDGFPHLAIGSNGLPYIFFRHYLHRIPMPEDQTTVAMGSTSQRLQPWYDTVRQMWDIFVVGFDGAKWLPVRELPESSGRCWMQSGSALEGNKLLYFWPVDGRTYADPHVKTAQIQFAEFVMTDPPASADAMKPFVSERIAVADAAPTEEQDLSRVRAARWQDSAPLHLFRGDLHRHTDISADGMSDGDILDTYRYAMDAAALDFMAITDHTGHQRLNYFHYDWWRNRQIATLFNNPGHFVTFFGYERTVTYPGGHRNVISTRRDAQPFRISDEEFTGIESYGTRLFPQLRATGDIAIPHTTGTGGGTNWNTNDSRAEPVVEIFQGLRGAFEEPSGPGKARGVSHPDGFVWNAWAGGHRLGVIASSDHNSTHQSYACVWAPDFTAESIHNALKARRSFAATDNIIVKFDALDRKGSVYKMGQEFAAAAAPEFRIEIQGTDALSKVELIRNDKIMLSRSPASPMDRFTYSDTDPLPGTAYYHVRIVQKNKQIAWSSPIWVRRP